MALRPLHPDALLLGLGEIAPRNGQAFPAVEAVKIGRDVTIEMAEGQEIDEADLRARDDEIIDLVDILCDGGYVRRLDDGRYTLTAHGRQAVREINATEVQLSDKFLASLHPPTPPTAPRSPTTARRLWDLANQNLLASLIAGLLAGVILMLIAVWLQQ